MPKSRLIGVLISAVVPALFWTAALALAGVLFGAPFDFTTLSMVAAAIAVFLAFVAAFTLAADDASDDR